MLEKNVAVISNSHENTDKYLHGIKGIHLNTTTIDDISADYDCVLISQDLISEDLHNTINEAKRQFIAVGIMTFDGSSENLDKLLEYGADDILVLPMPGQLIAKRIEALCRNSVLTSDPVDFSLFDRIAESNKGSGSFIIQDNDFTNIYRFVLRMLERLDQNAQLVIFNVNSRLKGFIEPDVMQNFSNIVRTALRRGDISSIHGRQLFVILMGADKDGGSKAAERLIETYYAHYDDGIYDLSYEIREINAAS